MYMRCRDDAERDRVAAAIEELLPGAMPEENQHLADTTINMMAATLWPTSHGWTIDAVEDCGVAYFIWATRTGGAVGGTYLTVSPLTNGWDDMDSTSRARAILTTINVYGTTRLDVLDDYVDQVNNHARFSNTNTADATLWVRLLTSPFFMDDTTSLMVGLNPAYPTVCRMLGVYSGYTDTLASLPADRIPPILASDTTTHARASR